MKTILRVLAAVAVFSASNVSAALDQAATQNVIAKAAALKAATNDADKQAAVDAIKSLCEADEENAAEIVAIAIGDSGLGGDTSADRALATLLLSSIVEAFSAKPNLVQDIVLKLVEVVPNLITAIQVSSGISATLATLVGEGSVLAPGTGENPLPAFSLPPPASR